MTRIKLNGKNQPAQRQRGSTGRRMGDSYGSEAPACYHATPHLLAFDDDVCEEGQRVVEALLHRGGERVHVSGVPWRWWWWWWWWGGAQP